MGKILTSLKEIVLSSYSSQDVTLAALLEINHALSTSGRRIPGPTWASSSRTCWCRRLGGEWRLWWTLVSRLLKASLVKEWPSYTTNQQGAGAELHQDIILLGSVGSLLGQHQLTSQLGDLSLQLGSKTELAGPSDRLSRQSRWVSLHQRRPVLMRAASIASSLAYGLSSKERES